MQFEKMLKIIETHTAGSPTRHIVGGAPQIEGNTMAEKMQYESIVCEEIDRSSN